MGQGCLDLVGFPSCLAVRGLQETIHRPGLGCWAAAVLEPPSTCLVAAPERLCGLRQSDKMHPGAICLQPLDQMVCKDSWGGGQWCMERIHLLNTQHLPEPQHSPTSWALPSCLFGPGIRGSE